MNGRAGEFVHRLRELGAGYGDHDTMAALRAGQLGKRRLLVLAVTRTFRDGPGGAQLDRALGLFEVVERAAPQAAEWVLGHPMVGVWATRCLNGSGAPDLGYLSAMAAAAAARAGIPFEISIPCLEGRLALPTLGVAHGLGDGAVVVSGSAGRLEMKGACGSVIEAGNDPRWTPIRHITTTSEGARLAVDVEDLDPYRAGYPWPPTHRLPRERADRLASLVSEAWAWIVLHCPRHAPSIAGLLRAIVPVVDPDRSRQVSAAARTACGAIALSEPRDADALALLMVHEIQHAKLDAVLDLVDLHVPDGRGRHRAPWRLDPRPVGALLQGAYAHLGVTDVWRTRRVRPWCGSQPVADFEFAYWRTQTSQAISTLRESGELTPAGVDFVAAMADTVVRWEGEPLPAHTIAAADDVDRATAIRWTLHNVVPNPEDVALLAAAWRAGGVAVLPDAAQLCSGPPRPADLDGLAAQIAHRAYGLTPTAGVGVTSPDLVTMADRAFLIADYAMATDSYRRRLIEAPDDDQAWIGLMLSLFHEALDSRKPPRGSGKVERQTSRFTAGESNSDRAEGKLTAAVRGLLARPDLVRALYTALARDSGSTPDGVAAWLAGYRGKELPKAVAVRCSS